MPARAVGERYHLWALAVWTFSKTTLTNPNDKLIALSGIAKRFACLLNDRYLVGLWRKNLEHQLVWTTVASTETGLVARPPIYRAPTWSWASIDRPVDLAEARYHQEILIRVKTVHITYATDDTTASQPDVRVLLDVPQKERNAFASDNSAHRLFYMPAAISSQESHRLAILIFRCLDKTMGLFERIGIGESEEEKDKELLLTDMSERIRTLMPSVRYEDGMQIIRII
ncbi:hypothetical protein EK21DRAFT_103869 [Setomelanomma holmii]|uniref:Uncharacterized protein n=1 Tax=Setomelanomma holmii TaxID=210430 RepID=A0A9P4H1S4_9PLEO|nr:hypothetical protein EK21DRAFT_103869 [Setomelanomma holmii]